MLLVWSSPGRVWEGRSVDVCCGLVGLAGGVGTRTGGAEGADRTCVRQGRNTGDRRTEEGLEETDPAAVADALASKAWATHAAGEGAKGLRLYEWARIA